MGIIFKKKGTFVKNAYHIDIWETYPVSKDISQMDLTNANVENNGYNKADSVYINWGQITLYNGHIVCIQSHNMGDKINSDNSQIFINQFFNTIQKFYGIYNEDLDVRTYSNYADGRKIIHFSKSYGFKDDAYTKGLRLSTSNQTNSYSMYIKIEKNNWVEELEGFLE